MSGWAVAGGNLLAARNAGDESVTEHRQHLSSKASPFQASKLVKRRARSIQRRTEASYNSAISACEPAREWQKATAILMSMSGWEQVPNDISFNAAISAAEKAGQWKHAIWLLGRMTRTAIRPDNISYNAAIGACAKPGEWQAALALVAEMDRNSLKRDEITYNCLSSACEKAGCWELALNLLLQRQGGTQVGSLVYEMCSGGWEPGLRETLLGMDLTPTEVSQVVWRLAKLARLGLSSKPTQPLAERARGVAAAVRPETFELKELSTVLWSLARLGVSDAPLMQRLSEAAFRRMEAGEARSLNVRNLANLAWALSMPDADAVGTLGLLQKELASRSVQLLSRSMSAASRTEFTTAALAILYAARLSDQLLPNASQVVRSALVALGLRLDLESAAPRVVPLGGSGPRGRAAASGALLPSEPLVQELPGTLLIRKPPHWQVDERDASYAVDNRGLLSSFTQAMKPVRQSPILEQTSHTRGFLHRLDVPSSGLILAATSFEAFYDLRFQLATGLLTRAYVILCHGLLQCSRTQIQSPVDWLSYGPDANSVSLVQGSGRPSRTLVKAVARSLHGSRAFTLVHVQIVTGRRHQIRVHTCYVGHPTVTDGKYTSGPTCTEDISWRLGEQDD